MIQTWVTYEVVKVLFLYGLNPKPNAKLGQIAPQIELYIQHVTQPNEETIKTARKVQNTLFRKTQHSSYFERLNFSESVAVAWKDDIKFMIPLLILTWLRQLQQCFKTKNNKLMWSKLGNDTPLGSVSRSKGKDPLSLVYLSKPDGPNVKVKQYTDIKPDESHDDKKDQFVIKSLEMWAMMILETPVENKLKHTTTMDNETKARYKTCNKMIDHKYQFLFTAKDFSVTKRKQNRFSNLRVKPKLDYSDKTTHELHSVINDGLISAQEAIVKLENKSRPTADDMTLVTALKSMEQAYIILANKTFQEESNGKTFDNLEKIKEHLDSKMPHYQFWGQKNDDEEEDYSDS